MKPKNAEIIPLTWDVRSHIWGWWLFFKDPNLPNNQSGLLGHYARLSDASKSTFKLPSEGQPETDSLSPFGPLEPAQCGGVCKQICHPLSLSLSLCVCVCVSLSLHHLLPDLLSASFSSSFLHRFLAPIPYLLSCLSPFTRSCFDPAPPSWCHPRHHMFLSPSTSRTICTSNTFYSSLWSLPSTLKSIYFFICLFFLCPNITV